MNDTIKTIIILTLFSIGGGGIAVFFHSLYSPSIEARKDGSRQSAAQRMFGVGARAIPVYEKKPLPQCYWIEKKDSVVIGYAFPVETRGYAGTISSLVGIDTLGNIKGIKILSTAGMPTQGMTVDDFIPKNSLWGRIVGKKNTVDTWFTEQFRGIDVNRPFIIDTLTRGRALPDSIKNERREGNMIAAVAGATASSQAIVRAIQKTAVSFLLAIKGKER